MACMSAAAVEETRTTGLHRCEGCRCFIHTAVACDAVCVGEAEGEYWCGHCHALARLYDAPPPTGDVDDGGSLPDDEEQDLASGADDKRSKSKRKESHTQPGPRSGKKQRCGNCNQLGHNKRNCKSQR